MNLPVDTVIIDCGTIKPWSKQHIKNCRGVEKHHMSLHTFTCSLLPRDDEKSVCRSLLYTVTNFQQISLYLFRFWLDSE